MNKSLGVLLLLASITPLLQADCGNNNNNNGCNACDCKVTSHSFFSVRPLYQTASPERVSLFHMPDLIENGRGGNLELTVFGSRSTNNDKLSRYFSPFCKCVLNVKEARNNSVQDLVSQNFNITTVGGTTIGGTGFESNISLCMRNSEAGIGVTYRHNISQYLDCETPWWIEISSPLTWVSNRVAVLEQIVTDGGGPANIAGLGDQVLVGSMVDAFAQPEWQFGRINPCACHTQVGLADIELKLGYEWLTGDCCGVESFIGVLIPTGNRPRAHNVFEPIVGNNRHWGFMTGHSAYFDIWEVDCWKVYGYVDTLCKYLFCNTEIRSFDLKYRPWSRYLEVYANLAQAQQAANIAAAGGPANALTAVTLSTPGINIFTKPLNVKPRFQFTGNVALGAESGCQDIELGFNFFARDAECVQLACPFDDGVAVKADLGGGRTNKFRTINNNLTALDDAAFSVANYTNAVLTVDDLDLESAAHPAVLSYIIYGAYGYRFENDCYPMFAGIGASYEFGGGNEVLNRWVFWGKFGFSF